MGVLAEAGSWADERATVGSRVHQTGDGGGRLVELGLRLVPATLDGVGHAVGHVVIEQLSATDCRARVAADTCSSTSMQYRSSSTMRCRPRTCPSMRRNRFWTASFWSTYPGSAIFAPPPSPACRPLSGTYPLLVLSIGAPGQRLSGLRAHAQNHPYNREDPSCVMILCWVESLAAMETKTTTHRPDRPADPAGACRLPPEHRGPGGHAHPGTWRAGLPP